MLYSADEHDNSEEVILFKSLTLEIFRTFNRVNVWVETCENIANNSGLNFLDFFILHTIHANGISKSISTISVALARDDNFNVNYSFKKLIKLNLIEKIKDSNSFKNILYRTTALGAQNIDNYNKVRDRIYNDNIINKENIKAAQEFIELTKKIRTMYNKALELISTQMYTLPK